MHINFYATFRQIVGGKTIDLPITGEVTVQHVLDQIFLRYPVLRRELFDEHDCLYPHVHVLIEGRDVTYLKDGLQVTECRLARWTRRVSIRLTRRHTDGVTSVLDGRFFV